MIGHATCSQHTGQYCVKLDSMGLLAGDRSMFHVVKHDSPFQRVRFSEPRRRGMALPSNEEFLARLTMEVTQRFARITGLTAIAIPIDLPGSATTLAPESLPEHPACVEFAGSDRCRQSAAAHLDELRRRPEIHWHRCPNAKYCAFVPVMWRGRCLAACKLVCADSIRAEDFAHHVELLDVLADNFLASETEFLSCVFPDDDGRRGGNGGSTRITQREARERASHPRVREALEYAGQHLSDPTMTVAGIARALDMNATYLAHLFAQQVAVRLSRYIATRRVELAEHLLSTTNWQIKRVAYESGHSNADWFSQVFRAHTGMTPREFRRRTRLA